MHVLEAGGTGRLRVKPPRPLQARGPAQPRQAAVETQHRRPQAAACGLPGGHEPPATTALPPRAVRQQRRHAPWLGQPASSGSSRTTAAASPTVAEQSAAGDALPGGGGGGGAGEEEARPEPEAQLVLLACGIGLATGASIVAFNWGIHGIRDSIWDSEVVLAGAKALRSVPESELWPKVVFPPLVGGVLVGALGLLAGGYEDRPAPVGASSVDQDNTQPSSAADSFTELRRLVERVQASTRPLWRSIAAAVTLGTGASLGPEGPSVDIGRSFAKALAARLRSRHRYLVPLLAAGSGAGVAAGFNAPISGVFFAVESVLQQRRDYQGGGCIDAGNDDEGDGPTGGLTIAMVLLASVLAAVVSQAGLGSSPAFRVPDYRLESLVELPLYLGFGALCGGVSASFGYSARVMAAAFGDIRTQSPVLGAAALPAVGGLTTGVLALGYPEILYQGFDNVNSILSSNGGYAPGLLVQIVVVKLIATSICRGSGLQGGLYAPSIFIGAALGSAFGQLAHGVIDPIAPLVVSEPQAYALVGVAAMLAATCSVPLTAVLLLFELTRDYLIILPTLAAVGISFWISSLLAPSLAPVAKSRGLASGAASPATAADAALLEALEGRLALGAAAAVAGGSTAAAAAAQALGTMAGAAASSDEALTVACAVEGACVFLSTDMPLAEALATLEREGQQSAVVLAPDGTVLGVVSRASLQRCLAMQGAGGAPACREEAAESSQDGQG